MNVKVKERVPYFEAESSELAQKLAEKIKDLRNQISDISSTQSWYFYLDWRRMTSENYLILCLGISKVQRNFSQLFDGCEVCLSLVQQLKDEINKRSKFYENTKFFKEIFILYSNPSSIMRVKDNYLPPPREWKGNFCPYYQQTINLISVRLMTPRRAKKTQRVRGYRDKGSRPSIDQIAIRQAQTFSYYEDIEKVLPLILRAGGDPIEAARRLGIIPREET